MMKLQKQFTQFSFTKHPFALQSEVGCFGVIHVITVIIMVIYDTGSKLQLIPNPHHPASMALVVISHNSWMKRGGLGFQGEY